jgi:hypothetical protein
MLGGTGLLWGKRGLEGAGEAPVFGRRGYLRRAAASLLIGLAASVLALSPSASAKLTESGAFRQQAELNPTDEIGNASTAKSVALSGDGNTALIGGPGDDEGQGAVWVFRRKGSNWVQQAKLVPTGETGNGRFGESVALSGDGSTALVGAPNDADGIGAAWTFTRTGSGWRQRGMKVTGPGEVGSGHFGRAVSLSADAKTALIGGPKDNQFTGAVWVFIRRGAKWRPQGEKIVGAEEENFETLFGHPIEDLFGESVSLSSDGNTALAGGPGDAWEGGSAARGPHGSAWVFTRSGRTWSQQGPKLVGQEGLGGIGGIYAGQSVAVSGQGDTALIGGPLDNWSEPYVGAAWAFTRSGSTWTQQGKKLKNSEPSTEEPPDERFGSGVALSEDGDTALIGSDEIVFGAWIFSRSGTTWTEQTPMLTCSPESCGGVALSADATTALVGATVYVRDRAR